MKPTNIWPLANQAVRYTRMYEKATSQLICIDDVHVEIKITSTITPQDREAIRAIMPLKHVLTIT